MPHLTHSVRPVNSANKPSLQLEHTVKRSVGPKNPMEHSAHCVEAVEFSNEPAVHGEQSDWPVSGWKKPGRHTEQLNGPTVAETSSTEMRPGAHCKHSGMPVSLAKRPDEHALHEDSPLTEDIPWLHGKQLVEPASAAK